MKLPFTCPNSSDSSSVSGMPAQLTATKGAIRARAAAVDSARNEFLADAAFAGDQDLGIRARDALDLRLEIEHRRARADQSCSLSSHRVLFLASNFLSSALRRASRSRDVAADLSTASRMRGCGFCSSEFVVRDLAKPVMRPIHRAHITTFDSRGAI